MRRARPTADTAEADIVALGLRASPIRDFYHRLLTTSWPKFFLLIALAYFIGNLLFAAVYWLGNDTAQTPDNFAMAFFYSVQTTTAGYAHFYPHSLFENITATIEAFIGLLGFALATGLTLARVARPTARILFSNNVIVTAFHGRPTLMFRMANQRHNLIFEAEVHLALGRQEVSPEGLSMRRVYDLAPIRGRNPMFRLSWTVMHRIEDGLLAEIDESELRDPHRGYSIVVTVTGLDSTFNQTVFARHIYLAKDILFDRRFSDIIGRTNSGRWTIDYDRFHNLTE
ncbi:MAG TPA: ATP-sensitive inward rectifier potassium channel 10 [Gammaproteobacteria bacterium]|nr:ATP-sensitive inward rectifier potassium channel 10 [Gammaproteobacteria bacterium]